MQGDLGVGAARLDLDDRRFQSRPQPGQGGAQIVGDGIAGVAQAADRLVQPVEHVVEALGELVVFVARAPHRRPRRHVAAARRVDDRRKAGDVPADVAADQHASGDAQQDDQRPGPPHRAQDLADVGLGFADVGADEQALAARQTYLLASRRAADHGALFIRLGQGEARPRSRAVRFGDGRAPDRAADRRPARLHQQVEHGMIGRRSFDHGAVEGDQAAAAVDVFQGAGLAFYPGVGAGGHLVGGGDVDIGQERAGRRREQGEEQQGQPERRRPQQARQAHGGALFRLPVGSPRRVRSAAWRGRSPCRSFRATARCGRR